MESTNNVADQLALARLFEELGEIGLAIRLYKRSMNEEVDLSPSEEIYYHPSEISIEAMDRLGAIYKRQHNYLQAVNIWERASEHQHLGSMIELAKFYEHQVKDYSIALKWAQSALDVTQSSNFPEIERSYWQPEVEHRIARLQLKFNHDAT